QAAAQQQLQDTLASAHKEADAIKAETSGLKEEAARAVEKATEEAVKAGQTVRDKAKSEA
nr:hypothetical protein [Desulfuromonadales bacterium]